ncbi:hypothetical protein [Chitinophaga oryzae]|nr:hypothetical protein [Chitinophaga oryzae]
MYVLMPGAWHGGWYWQQVSIILRGDGTGENKHKFLYLPLNIRLT